MPHVASEGNEEQHDDEEQEHEKKNKATDAAGDDDNEGEMVGIVKRSGWVSPRLL